MGEPNILSIPPELQAAIVSYITRPSDLKSLCLTCEQLSAVATEQLYNEVYLDVGRDTRKSGFFAHNHRGHPHVRGFTAFTPSVGPEHSTETYCPSANLAIRLVLQVLPRDRLKRFVTELSIDADTASTLFTRQTMMEDVALGIIKRNTLQLPLLAPNLVAKLQKLVIPFSYGHSSYVPLINPEIRLYGELLASCRHLKHLALCRASNPNDDESALSDQAETLFVQLFRPLESRNAVLSLDELRFEDLDFPTSTRHLTSMVDFGNLQWLSIIGCCNSESLLLDLIIVFGNTVPKLRGLIWHDDMVHDQYSFDLIQQLLRSFSGLEHLSIITEDYRLSGSFDLSCLKTHLGTTRCLRLAQGYLKPVPYGNSDLWNISLPELRLLVQQTPELRKLLLDFPSLSMQDIASGNMADYDEFIDTIATLPRLEILHVPTWPIARPCENPDVSEPRRAYLKDLDTLAKHLVRRLATSQPLGVRLKAICFGRSSNHQPVDLVVENATGLQNPGRVFYEVRQSGSASSAVRLDRDLMRYDEPSLDMIARPHGKDRGMSVGAFGSMHALRHSSI